MREILEENQLRADIKMDSSPELSEMAEYMDYYEQKGEEEDVTDKKQLKPHAQAHLLSATENCKVCVY